MCARVYKFKSDYLIFRHGLLPDQTPVKAIMNPDIQPSDDDSDLGPDWYFTLDYSSRDAPSASHSQSVAILSSEKAYWKGLWNQWFCNMDTLNPFYSMLPEVSFDSVKIIATFSYGL